ncbi:hypothetical protein SRRS_12160 [Sporomusa rhizae]|uniref:hypothetical protein n=1 Tax=Sporomusa rhizae TaxID=357999 RepID=UPI00352B2FC2
MFSLFLEHPIITGIAIVLALIIVVTVGNVDPQLGEILGMNMVFPFLVIGFMMILWAILASIKAFQTGNFKKNKS